MSEAFDWVVDSASKAADMVKQFFKSFAETGVLQNAINLLKDAKDAISNVLDGLDSSGVFESLGNTFGQIASQVLIAADNVAKFIAKLKPSQVKLMVTAVKDLALAFAAFKIGSSIFNQFKKVKSSAEDTYKSVKSLYDRLSCTPCRNRRVVHL